MPFLSTCSTDKAQERAQKMPHRTSKAAANLRMQRLSENPENAVQLETKNRMKPRPMLKQNWKLKED
jgi:hypothetical protein